MRTANAISLKRFADKTQFRDHLYLSVPGPRASHSSIKNQSVPLGVARPMRDLPVAASKDALRASEILSAQ
jgi:hypothetical protein